MVELGEVSNNPKFEILILLKTLKLQAMLLWMLSSLFLEYIYCLVYMETQPHTNNTHTHKPTHIHTHTHTHTNIVVYEYLKPFTFFTQNFLCILWVHFTILHESKECGEFFIIIDTHTQKHTHTHSYIYKHIIN